MAHWESGVEAPNLPLARAAVKAIIRRKREESRCMDQRFEGCRHMVMAVRIISVMLSRAMHK